MRFAEAQRFRLLGLRQGQDATPRVCRTYQGEWHSTIEEVLNELWGPEGRIVRRELICQAEMFQVENDQGCVAWSWSFPR